MTYEDDYDKIASMGDGTATTVAEVPAQTITLTDDARAYDQIANLGDKPFDLGASVWESAKPWMDYYGAKTGTGARGVIKGLGGFAGFLGLESDEDMLSRYSDTELDKREQAKIQAFEDGKEWNPFRWLGEGLQSVPQLATTVAGGAAGTLVGTVALPTKTPGAPVAGRYSGAFAATAAPMIGEAYLTYRQNGADPAVARTAALVIGTSQALVEAFELKTVGDIAKLGFNTFQKTAAGAAAREAATPLVAGLLKNFTKEVIAEDVQQVLDMVGRYWAGVSDKVGAESDQNITDRGIPRWDKILSEIGDTTTKAAMGAFWFTAAGGVAGAATGRVKHDVDAVIESQSTLFDNASRREAGMLINANRNIPEADTKLEGRVLSVEEARTLHAQAQSYVDGQTRGLKYLVKELDNPANEFNTGLVESVKAARDKLKTFRRERDAAELELNKAVALDRASNPNLSAEETNKLAGEVAQINDKLRQIELDAAKDMLKGKVEETKDELAKTEDQIKEKVDAYKQTAQSKIDDFKTKRDQAAEQVRSLEAEVRQIETEMARSVPASEQQNAEALEKNRAKLGKKRDQLQAKVDKGKAVLADADKKLSKAQNQLSAKEDVDIPGVKSLAAKQAKLQGRLEQLDTLGELLQDDLLNSEDLKALRLKAPTMKARTLAALASKKVVRAAKRAAIDTRKTIAENQAILKKVILKAKLPKDGEARLLKRLNAVQTNDQLGRVVEDTEREIQNILDKAAADKYRSKLNKLVKTKAVTPEAKRFLDLYKFYLSNPKEAQAELEAEKQRVLDYAAKVDNILAEGGIDISEPLPQAVHTLVASQTANLRDMSANQVKALYETVRGIAEQGNADRLTQMEAQAQEDLAFVERQIDSVNGTKPADPNQKPGAIRKFKRTVGAPISPFNGLLAIASQHDPNATLVNDLDATQEMLAYENSTSKHLNDLIDTLAGDSKGGRYWGLLHRMVTGAKQVDVGEHTIRGTGNRDGGNSLKEGSTKYERLRMTRNEAIKLYNQMRDPSLKRGLQEGNGYTFLEDVQPGEISTEEALDRFLNAEDKLLADRLRDFYRKYFRRINAHYSEKTGMPLDYNADYSGYAQRTHVEGDDLGSESDFLRRQYEQGNTTPGSVKQRVNSGAGLKRADALVDAIQHVKMFENDIAFGDYARKVRKVLSNPRFRSALDNKYGTRLKRYIDTTFTNIIGTRRQQDAAIFEFLDTVRRNMGAAYTSARPWQIVKQMTSTFAFMNYANPVRMAGEYAKMLNPAFFVRTALILEKSSQILPTRSGNIILEMREAIENAKGLRDKGEMSFSDILALPTTIGDRASIWVGGGALYNTLIKEGKTHEQAIKIVDRAVNETQSSALRNQQHSFELGGSVQRAMSLFTKQPAQMLTRELNDLRRAVSLRDAKSVANLARTVALMHGMQFLFQMAVLAQAQSEGADDDRLDSKMLDVLINTVLGAFSGTVVLGDLLHDAAATAIYESLDERYRGRPAEDAISGLKRNALTTLRLSIKAFKEGDLSVEDAFKLAHAYNRSFGVSTTGLPADALVTWLENIYKSSTSVGNTSEGSTIDEAPGAEGKL